MQKSKSLLIKVLTFVCSVCCVLALAFGLVACSDGADGRGIKSATINSDGELVITYTDDTTDNLGKVVGNDGAAGSQGIQGVQGNSGADGVTPTIGTNGNWYIGETDTGVKAEGTDGETPTVTINSDGYWVINGEPTTVKAVGTDGDNGASIASITSYTKDGKVYLTVTLTDDTVLEDVELTLPGNVSGGTEGSTYDPEVCPNDEDGEHAYELVLVCEGKAATCDEEGTGVYVCANNCGSAIFGSIEKTSHNWETKWNSDEGYKGEYISGDSYNHCVDDLITWQQCSICGAVKDATVKEYALGHNWAVEHDENGEVVLDDDDNPVLEISDMPYLVYDEDEEAYVELNICEYGYQSGNVCMRCGEVQLLEHHPATGHSITEAWIKASAVSADDENYDATKKDPTLENAGYIYGYCSKCGEWKYVEIPAFTTDGKIDEQGNNLSDGYTFEVIDSKTSCSVQGNYEYTWTYTYLDAEGNNKVLELTYEVSDPITDHYIMVDGEREYLTSTTLGKGYVLKDGETYADLIKAGRLATYDSENNKYVLATGYVEGTTYYYVYNISEYPDDFKYYTTTENKASCTDVVYGFFVCANCQVINENQGVTPVLFMGEHVAPTTEEATAYDLSKAGTGVVTALTVVDKDWTLDSTAFATALKADATFSTLDAGTYYTIAADNDTIGVTFYICSKCGEVVVTDTVDCLGHEWVSYLYTVAQFNTLYGSDDDVMTAYGEAVAARVADDVNFIAAYVLVTLDNKDKEYLEITPLADDEVELGEITTKPDCVHEGAQKVTYDDPKSGEKVSTTISVPKTSHGVQIGEDFYYLFDMDMDLSAYVVDGVLDQDALEKAYPGYLYDSAYFAGVVKVGDGYYAVYYYTVGLLRWNTTSSCTCADDGGDRGWFHCDLADHGDSTLNVTPIYVRGAHVPGSVEVDITYGSDELAAIYSGTTYDDDAMKTVANWTIKDEDYTVYNISGSCDQAEYKVYLCTVCNNIIVIKVTPAGTHNYVVKYQDADGNSWHQPTETETSTVWYECTKCGEGGTIELPALGDIIDEDGKYVATNLATGYTLVVTVDASCVKAGYLSFTYAATVDDDYDLTVENITVTLPKIDHVYNDDAVESTWIVCEEDGTLYTYYGKYCINCGKLVPTSKEVLLDDWGYAYDVATYLADGKTIDIDLRQAVVLGEETSVSLLKDEIVNLALVIEEGGFYNITVDGDEIDYNKSIFISGNASYVAGTSTVTYLKAGSYNVSSANYWVEDGISFSFVVEATKAPEFDFEQDLVIGLNENLTSGSNGAKYYFQVSEAGTYEFTVSGDHSGVYLYMPLTEDNADYVTGGYDTENDVSFTAEIEAGVWYYVSIFSSDWAKDGVCNLTIKLVD